jgi:hypothetical protein
MKTSLLFILLFLYSFQNIIAQDSSRFDFLSKNEKALAFNFVTQGIDTFLFLEKQNFAGLVKDTIIAIYRKNAITYKQFSLDRSDFSTAIKIDNAILDSFFINKIARLNRKQRKIRKERRKWNVQLFPNGTYYDLNFYFDKKQYFAFLGLEYYAGGYYKPEFYFWFDKLKVELRK